MNILFLCARTTDRNKWRFKTKEKTEKLNCILDLKLLLCQDKYIVQNEVYMVNKWRNCRCLVVENPLLFINTEEFKRKVEETNVIPVYPKWNWELRQLVFWMFSEKAIFDLQNFENCFTDPSYSLYKENP